MCCENISKNTSIVLWNRAVTGYGKSHPLFIKTAVTTHGNPSTAYQMSYDNTRGKTSIILWLRAVITCGKSHTLHGETAVTTYVRTYGKLKPLFFEREQCKITSDGY